MRIKKTVLIILLAVLVLSVAADIEGGVTLNPESSNAVFTTQNPLSIDNFKVYNDKIKVNQTNITVQNDQLVEAKIWNNTYMRTSSGMLEYSFNDSVQFDITNLNSLLFYQIRFNDSLQREVNGQTGISISAPSHTNISVTADVTSLNNEPTYNNVKPENDATALKRPANLSFTVSDADLDELNITWYDASDDSIIDSKNNISSGSTVFAHWSSIDTNTSYTWYAKITDGISNTTVGPRSFTTNSPPELNPDQQYYDNFSINHEFEVEAFARDYDGESDINKCEIYYNNNEGDSGTIEGAIYNSSYGTDKDVKCNKNLSSQLAGIKVGDTLTTEVRFYDGGSWANTTQDSNPVPNNPPTPPTDFTNISENIVFNQPTVSWLGEDDPDGDEITVKAYTGSSPNPITLDNSAEADSPSMSLGNNISLLDGNTYYYRLRVCDEYGLCGSYTINDRFSLNEEPRIESHNLNDSVPQQGDLVRVETNVTDTNLESVNFTVWEAGSKIVNNQNGTIQSGNWSSPEISLDQKAEYRYEIVASDRSGESTEANRTFNLGYKPSGKYIKSYTTSNISEIKAVYYADFNSGDIDVKANTSSSNKKLLDNDTWTELVGEDVTLEFTLTTSNTSETPVLRGYDLYYKTDPITPGYVRTSIKDFGSEVEIDEFIVNEDQPTGTNVTYELRNGPTDTVNGEWTDWKLCLDTCEPNLPKNRHFQYRVNLSSQNNKVPEVQDIQVKYG